MCARKAASESLSVHFDRGLLGLDASGLHLFDDRDLWARALADARIVVSKDEDFLYLANQPGDAGRFLWVRLGNCRNDALLTAFARSFDTIVAAFDSGQTVVELI